MVLTASEIEAQLSLEQNNMYALSSPGGAQDESASQMAYKKKS